MPPCLPLCLPADYLELKSSVTGGPGIDPKYTGSGAVAFRHSMRTWSLPNLTASGEFFLSECGHEPPELPAGRSMHPVMA